MPTDTDKTLNGTPEPFRRPVIWGRPPQTVFRAGPLPRGGSLPPLPETPRLGAAAGILSGSMIPRAVPNPDLTVRPLPTVDPVRPAAPTPASAPVRPVAVAPEPVSVPVAGSDRKPANRTPLYAGIGLAAVIVLALGGWIWTRSPAAPASDIAISESLPAPVAVTESPVIATPPP